MQILLSDYEFLHAVDERLRDTLRSQKTLKNLLDKTKTVNLFAPLTVYTPNLVDNDFVDLTPLDLAFVCLDSDDLCQFLNHVSLPAIDQTVLSSLVKLTIGKTKHVSQTSTNNIEKKICEVCSDLRSVFMGAPDSVMFLPDILSSVLVRRKNGQAFVTPELKNILLQKGVKATKNNRQILRHAYVMSYGSEFNFVKNYLDFCDKSWFLDEDNQQHFKKVLEGVSYDAREEIKVFFDKKCLSAGLDGEKKPTKARPHKM